MAEEHNNISLVESGFELQEFFGKLLGQASLPALKLLNILSSLHKTGPPHRISSDTIPDKPPAFLIFNCDKANSSFSMVEGEAMMAWQVYKQSHPQCNLDLTV